MIIQNNSTIEEHKIAAAEAVAKRVSIEDEKKSAKFCTSLASAKQRNADLIKVTTITRPTKQLLSNAINSSIKMRIIGTFTAASSLNSYDIH